jgi:hypothetical protein
LLFDLGISYNVGREELIRSFLRHDTASDNFVTDNIESVFNLGDVDILSPRFLAFA